MSRSGGVHWSPRRAAFLVLVVATLAVAAACGNSASLQGGGDGTAGRPAGGGNAPASAPTAAPTAAPYVAASAAPAAPGTGVGGGTTESGGQAPLTDEQLIVRTGSLALEVANIDTSVLSARAKIIGLGGYVSDSQQTNTSDEDGMALITYRIPASRWDDALDALRGLASKVLNEDTQAVEVTGQVVDLDARLSNLRSTELALQSIMAKATKISDILDVQNQLTSVQGEIEQLTAQKNHLSDQAALGTLAVTYSLPPAPPVVKASEGFNLSAEVDRALAQLVRIGQSLLTIGVWFAIVWAPLLLGVLLIVALAIFVARRLGYGRPGGATGTPA
jgi:hypothetical protein